ncbi:MAG TPA: protein kinase, partial [Acidobacteriota bacterium]
LGKGGMGAVYKAQDTQLERFVALKFLAERFMQDPAAVERFIREAKTASALNHPNIVTIHEIGEAPQGRFIVMELVTGRSLRALAGQGPSLEPLISAGRQVSKALAVAHAAGIVHRDIKPENIMLRDDGYAKVVDFGLACLTVNNPQVYSAETVIETVPGILSGTAPYMSPEQARGGTLLSSATDIFSLGVVLYELATGRGPFAAESVLATLHAIISQAPPTPSRLNCEIPSSLEALILQMLEKEPSRRPTAEEVEASLADIGRKRGGEVKRRIARSHTVGRDRERAELSAGFESATAGHGLLLCVSGEPGIGKTTLVEEFIAEIRAGLQPCNVARGRCSERLAGAEAYLPFLEALESLIRVESSQTVAHLMKTAAPNWYAQIKPAAEGDDSAQSAPEVKAASQERMKRELAAFFAEVSRTQPLILFFDDLHWADVSTIDMLAYLSVRMASARMLIVVSFRPSEILLSNHPFLSIKLDLEGRGLCREIALGFLGTDDIERYLELEFPGQDFSREFSTLIHEKTEGNPLFVVDLLRYLRERRVIDQVQGRWVLAQSLPDLERELPQSVRSMIQRKIDQLGEGDRRLLLTASVQGHEFDSAVVSRVLALDPADVEERLEFLERVLAFVHKVGEWEFPDRTLTVRYGFVHVLYQNALYGSLAPTRKASLSAAVAQALLDHYGEQNGTIAAELAFLLETARDFSRASQYFQLAAQNAARVSACQEAIVLARRGLELLRSVSPSPERDSQELMLLMTLSGPLMTTKGYGSTEVEEIYRRAQDLCQQMADKRQVFFVLVGLIAFYGIRGNYAMARKLGEQLVRLAEGEKDQVFRLHAVHGLGFALGYVGELKRSRELMEQANDIYDYRQHSRYAAIYAIDLGVNTKSQNARTLWLLGYPDQAVVSTAEAIALAEKISHPFSLAFALMFDGKAHQLRREVQRTLEQTEKALQLANEHGMPQIAAWAGVWHGWALAELGRTGEGIEQMRESLAAQRAMGSEIVRPHFLGLLAESLSKAGETTAALAALAEAFDAARATGECYYEAELYRLRGEILLNQTVGQPAGTTYVSSVAGQRADFSQSQSVAVGSESCLESENCFRRALDIARRQRARSLELRAAVSLIRSLGSRAGPQDRSMLEEIYNWFTEGFDTKDLQDGKELLEVKF